MSDNNGIVWEDPPPPERAINEWAAIGEQLKSRPGEWARVTTRPKAHDARMVASRINNDGYARLRTLGRFEAAARRLGEKWAVYARYVGEDGAE
jgi:hypothetical protein